MKYEASHRISYRRNSSTGTDDLSDGSFIGDAQKTMRFHSRFEIGEQGERTFQRASRIPAEFVSFPRQYSEEANP